MFIPLILWIFTMLQTKLSRFNPKIELFTSSLKLSLMLRALGGGISLQGPPSYISLRSSTRCIWTLGGARVRVCRCAAWTSPRRVKKSRFLWRGVYLLFQRISYGAIRGVHSLPNTAVHQLAPGSLQEADVSLSKKSRETSVHLSTIKSPTDVIISVKLQWTAHHPRACLHLSIGFTFYLRVLVLI